ncbi:MAG: hypothetical protein ACREQM_11135 [Candidatus Dormibacteraceae bacterium]
MPNPVVGWRLWRVHGGDLWSWGIDAEWQPGDGQARCLHPDPQSRCAEAPGEHCLCGFWALSDPQHCVRKVRKEHVRLVGTMQPVIGLMLGWGSVMLHGAEGFRAERARPLCLFDNWIWDSELDLLTAGRVPWWRRLQDGAGLRSRDRSRRYRAPVRAAQRFGIPLVTLQAAVQFGVLRELGVASELVQTFERRLPMVAGRAA